MNGFEVLVVGTRGGLCLARQGEVFVSLKSYSINHIYVEFFESGANRSWCFTGFYGAPMRMVGWMLRVYFDL